MNTICMHVNNKITIVIITGSNSTSSDNEEEEVEENEFLLYCWYRSLVLKACGFLVLNFFCCSLRVVEDE